MNRQRLFFPLFVVISEPPDDSIWLEITLGGDPPILAAFPLLSTRGSHMAPVSDRYFAVPKMHNEFWEHSTERLGPSAAGTVVSAMDKVL